MTGARYMFVTDEMPWLVTLHRPGVGWYSAAFTSLQDAYAWLFRRGLFDPVAV